MSGIFLKVDGVSKRFGEIQALKDVGVETHENELLVVLGATGAGKTTLLRCIAGLEDPDEGRVHMGGADVTGDHPALRDVAYVFQNFALYPTWSVRRNMAFPLRAPGRRLPTAEIEEQIAWAAEMLHIEHLLDRPASRLSGGEMQRVAIGRSIVRRPRLFLMDEPLTNLDAKLREQLRVELVALRRELSTPMVYVTHDQAEALSMGDRIAVLEEGKLLQVGTPQEVYRRPVSPAVARQLGQPQINLIEVNRTESGWNSSGGLGFQVSDIDGDRATVGIRPESISLSGGEEDAVVQVVEDTGPTVVVVAEWCGEMVHILGPKHAGLKIGDRIRPQIDQSQLVAWPAEAVAAS